MLLSFFSFNKRSDGFDVFQLKVAAEKQKELDRKLTEPLPQAPSFDATLSRYVLKLFAMPR